MALPNNSPNRPAYRCRRRCLLPTGRNLLHDALQSHRLPFWFGLAGSISGTVRCRRGQLYLGTPDTYPCRAARLSRWFLGTKIKPQPSVTRLWVDSPMRSGRALLAVSFRPVSTCVPGVSFLGLPRCLILLVSSLCCGIYQVSGVSLTTSTQPEPRSQSLPPTLRT